MCCPLFYRQRAQNLVLESWNLDPKTHAIQVEGLLSKLYNRLKLNLSIINKRFLPSLYWTTSYIIHFFYGNGLIFFIINLGKNPRPRALTNLMDFKLLIFSGVCSINGSKWFSFLKANLILIKMNLCVQILMPLLINSFKKKVIDNLKRYLIVFKNYYCI